MHVQILIWTEKHLFDLDFQLDSTVFISDAQSQTNALIFLFDMKHINIGQNNILHKKVAYMLLICEENKYANLNLGLILCNKKDREHISNFFLEALSTLLSVTLIRGIRG